MVVKSTGLRTNPQDFYTTLEAKVMSVESSKHQFISLGPNIGVGRRSSSNIELRVLTATPLVRKVIVNGNPPIRYDDLVRLYICTAEEIYMPELEYGWEEGMPLQRYKASEQPLPETVSAFKLELLEPTTQEVVGTYDLL